MEDPAGRSKDTDLANSAIRISTLWDMSFKLLTMVVYNTSGIFALLHESYILINI